MLRNKTFSPFSVVELFSPRLGWKGHSNRHRLFSISLINFLRDRTIWASGRRLERVGFVMEVEWRRD